MIIWLTGQSGAGKTSLAKQLQKDWFSVILDGDEMRNSISLGVGFSRKEREEHNHKIARLAVELNKQTNVIVAVIAPEERVRKEISEKYPEIKFVYVNRTLPEREGHFYEEPNCFTVDHDVMGVEDSCEKVKEHFNLECLLGLGI
jgi:adenylylsulfate kinase